MNSVGADLYRRARGVSWWFEFLHRQWNSSVFDALKFLPPMLAYVGSSFSAAERRVALFCNGIETVSRPKPSTYEILRSTVCWELYLNSRELYWWKRKGESGEPRDTPTVMFVHDGSVAAVPDLRTDLPVK